MTDTFPHHRLLTRLFALGASVVMITAVSAEGPAAVTAKAALARLEEGNAQFVSDAPTPRANGAARRSELVKGQAPFAIILSCADSRVPPEIVFNVGLGELFVVRAAGQVPDRSVLASVEYAAEHLHSPLLVVMGHESCGAVKASIETTASLGPNLDFLLAAIKPAVSRSAPAHADDRLRAAIFANVEQVVNDTLGKSEMLAHLVESGTLTVVGAYYELSSGRVTFSDPIARRSAANQSHQGK